MESDIKIFHHINLIKHEIPLYLRLATRARALKLCLFMLNQIDTRHICYIGPHYAARAQNMFADTAFSFSTPLGPVIPVTFP